MSAHELDAKPGPDGRPPALDPFHNPSYPRRDHFGEKARLDQALRLSEERLAAARERLKAGSKQPPSELQARIYHQLLGIRDQLAESARRMPLETGGLYREDSERFEQAVAALERVWQKWQELGA